MRRAAAWAACLVLTSAAARAESPAFRQDQAHFEQAIRSDSTAPYYVLVTIVDDVQQKPWTGCVPATFLEGAVHIEHGLGYDEAGIDASRSLLLAARDRVFHFANPRALANIPIDAYAPADLERARAYLHAHGTAFLLSTDWDKIGAANKLNRTALACAIVEHGLAARMSDGTAETFAEP